MRLLFSRKPTAKVVLDNIEAHRRSGKGWDKVDVARMLADLQRLVDEHDVATLLHILDITDVFDNEVVLALGQIGDPIAVPVLLNRLQTATGRDNVVLALSMIGDEQAIHPIVETWSHGFIGPYEKALVQLASRHRRQVLDEVIPLLKHDNDHIRRNAMYCLRSLRAEEAVSALVEAAANDKIELGGVSDRTVVMQVLKDIGGASAEAAFQKLAK